VEDEDFDQAAWYQQELEERAQRERDAWGRQPALNTELDTLLAEQKALSWALDRIFRPEPRKR
jgi:hypothetical protein